MFAASLRRDPGALMGFMLLVLWLSVAVLGPTLVGTDPNDQELLDGSPAPSLSIETNSATCSARTNSEGTFSRV